MSADTAAVALAVPGAGGWDFGDFPYGLEPLSLPHWSDAALLTGVAGEALVESARRLRAAAEAGELGTTPATGDDLERLFWFRWITGHQLSFVIWQLLADAQARLARRDGDPLGTSVAITEYVRGYSALLLYTASSTRRIYNETIRPSMYRLHSTFSGTWSSDYAAVRSLFRGRRLPPVAGSEAEALAREVSLCHQIHLGAAAKLVVDGRSLLQHLVDNPVAQQPRRWKAIFDCYFLTLRDDVTGQEVLSQLLRRCKAVVLDLATNGLHPAVAGHDDTVPAELRTPAVLARERRIVEVLLRVVDLAMGAELAE